MDELALTAATALMRIACPHDFQGQIAAPDRILRWCEDCGHTEVAWFPNGWTVDYDKRGDTLFVGSPERVTTIERQGYDLDLDADGRPCGIELARARELLMGATP